MAVNSVDRVFKGRHPKEKPKFTKSKSYGEKPHNSKTKDIPHSLQPLVSSTSTVCRFALPQQHFQYRMAEVTEGLEGMICHIDDLLVWGRDQGEHDTRLHAVLQRLERAGITLHVDKCELSKTEVAFLGHIITPAGIHPDPRKTEAISKMAEPTNVSELRSFLGMVNQLGRFIPQLAEKDKPLRDVLSKKNCWVWDVEQATAFRTLKKALSSPPVLAMYDSNKDTKVSADASSYGLGGVLLQKNEEEWKPVAYASRSLTPTEQRYAQVEKEALGLTWACERFRDFLIGKQFCLETDHKPLLSLLGAQALDLLPPRIQCFRMRLMHYSYSIVYAPGKSLWTADTLSRSPVKSSMPAEEKELMESTNIYVDCVIENLPVSHSYMENLKSLKLTVYAHTSWHCALKDGRHMQSRNQY